MKAVYVLIFIFLSTGLFAQKNDFIPDTSLSGLSLQDSVSLKSIIPEFKKVVDYIGPGDKIYLINIDKSEIATLIFHSGSGAYIIAEIAVDSYAETILDKSKSINIPLDKFITESGIKLGITRSNLIQIKGSNYTSEIANEKETLKYKIEKFNESDILIRYNYPAYYANYQFIKEKLIHISFGFEYP